MAQRFALLLRASWQTKICEFLPAARSFFSVGHFDPLIPLRVKTSAGWRHLIFNDLDALQMESVGHFGQLIFTEWEWRVTDKTGVIKMGTPVALPRMQSSYHFDNFDFDTATIKFPKWELDSAGVANQVTESVTWFQMTAQIPTLGIWEWAI